jgi:uncharacterized repeat protein (TIGR01451 family)
MKKISFIVVLLLSFTAQSQNITFPDANFKAKLLQNYGVDSNQDNEISIAEANVYSDGLTLSNANIVSLSGIEHFTNVSRINCSYNQITSINLSGMVELSSFDCTRNQLTSLTLSNLPRLRHINCYYSQLNTISISNLPALTDLFCEHNQLTSLDIVNCPNLLTIHCYTNNLTSLNVSNMPRLTDLNCGDNQLTELDCSNLPRLTNLACYSNLLTSLLIKNGSNEYGLVFHGNPNLRYICADEGQVPEIQNYLSMSGIVNCHVNSYCTFEPGGAFYIVQGDTKYDYDNNGYSTNDIVVPNVKFNITNGAVSGSVYSNGSGNYAITPVLENPSFFTISPASINVAFPAQASPFTQNFCVTAIGLHPDLEITLLPLDWAIPGFDATYKLVYKNKGNTTQSGAVNLTFNDAALDLITANPAVATQLENNLSWTFTDLHPFETREIIFTVNINSPMETPAVNGADVLTYTATITSPAIDDMPNDNTFTLNQTVFNSYDPNDKTCLEGNTITPDKVGEYVHYMIRFENTGTFPAQNIVVKDMIDTAKFDSSTLVPIKGSHPFVTNISAGNKVEFIFENINLPFDDATNEGYVAFKIKTLPSLTNGDTFSNTANIYFDYNFPIVTNTATTTIQSLSNQDFEFSNYVVVVPNPVHDVFNIRTKATININTISIYNTLGQLIMVVPNAKETKTINVSNLKSGNYFIKIDSDKGTSNAKFVKM